MAEEYERRSDLDRAALVEDVRGEGVGEVRDRGLFNGHHGHRRDYYDEADPYASDLGGGYGRAPGVVYEGEQGLGGGGYYGPQPGPGMGYEDGYGEGYGGGYAPRRPPEVAYGEASDLGTGLMDSNIRTRPDYGSSLTRPDFAGVPVGAYEMERGRHGHHHGYGPEADYEEERRHKRYAEAAAAAALGYGLHERHEKNEAEERLEELGYDGDGRRRHEHHLYH